ncbi:MAG: hypothetical protein DCC58_18495 [Chloroflexi bacterium]|nr:MAG: hypothetical protein DCC58_18495 [Chloroflexota bacterium]
MTIAQTTAGEDNRPRGERGRCGSERHVSHRLSSLERWAGPAALLGASAIWGFVPVSTRHVIGVVSPEHAVLARFLFSSLAVLLVLATLRPALPARRHWPRAVYFGLLGTLGFNVPLTFGLQHIEAGTAALLTGTSPLFTAALAALVLHEQLRPRMIFGLGLALAGSVVVAAGTGGGFGFTGDALVGSALVLLAAILWAIYSVTVKPWLGPIPPASIPMLGSLFGLLIVAPFSARGFAAGLEQLDGIGWLAMLQFAVGASVVAPILFAQGLQRTPASRAGLYGYLPPLFGVISGAILLDEVIGPATALGGVLILGGVLLAALGPSPAAVDQPSEEAVN